MDDQEVIKRVLAESQAAEANTDTDTDSGVDENAETETEDDPDLGENRMTQRQMVNSVRNMATKMDKKKLHANYKKIMAAMDDEEMQDESVDEGKAPRSQKNMIQSMVDKAGKMDAKKLHANYGKIMKSMKSEGDDMDDDGEEPKGKKEKGKKPPFAKKGEKKDDDMKDEGKDEDEDDEGKGKKKLDAGCNYKKKSTLAAGMKKEDLDIEDDMNAIFAGEELSPEFKERLTNVFETILLTKINTALKAESAKIDEWVEEERENMKAELAARLDEYADHFAKEWAKNNKATIDNGLQNEIAMNFMADMKAVFEKHNINIPQEKVDIAAEMAEENDQLKDEMDKRIDENIKLQKEIDSLKKSRIVDDVCEDLTTSQAEQVRALSESIDFDSDDTDEFRSRLEDVKDRYNFAEDGPHGDAVSIDESYTGDETDGDEPAVHPQMLGVMEAINRSSGNTGGVQNL